MAKKKTVRKTHDVDRSFSKADETDKGLWLEAFDTYYEENLAVSEEISSHRDETEPQPPGLYGVENLFNGEMEAILILGTPDKTKSISQAVKAQQGLSAFTLAYAGRGVFRYALPSEEESIAGSLRLMPSDPSKVGNGSDTLRQW
jgi:hypothetical protein